MLATQKQGTNNVKPNLAVECMLFLEVSGLNLYIQTTYLLCFVVFLSPSRQIPGEYLKLSHDGFHIYPFQIHSLVVLPSDAIHSKIL
jgi:hypothetical protein